MSLPVQENPAVTAPPPRNTTWLVVIGLLSVAVPVLVALLLFMPRVQALNQRWVYVLPHLNAVLNSATALALLGGYYFIRRNQRRFHITAMLTAFGLSSLFLISYVIYHAATEPTRFGGEGVAKGIYLLILLTHIALAVVIVPLVLLSIYYGLTRQYTRHRRLTRWTFPIWLYVAVTGVVVYLMISPYYQH